MPFFKSDDSLQQAGDRLLSAAWAEFPSLARNQIAITWLVYDDPSPVNTGGAISVDDFWTYPIRGFSYRGVERVYPASVVKVFYLVAIHEWLEQGMVMLDAELERAMRDMIVDSSNDATSLVMDVLSGTTSGPALPEGPFETWKNQRNIVNRYFQSLDWPELESINVNQKTWGDGPYGRERLFLGEQLENRNALTTDAVARLLHSIIGGVAVTAGRSQLMMTLLRRTLDQTAIAADPENQITGFLGESLPPTAKLWSKAGWTSRVRHDAAYIEVPGHRPYLLVVFTEGQGDNADLIPFISKHILEELVAL
ncbi:MAG: serine hydrolase [Leptolyngbyaceae bacterium]|nr:serine hydrolase [Leptolyngbyaceae bacterium]